MNFPRFVVSVGTLAIFLGCGGSGAPSVSKEAVDKQSQAKLQALKDIADALGKNSNSPELPSLMENWRSMPFDVSTHPKETEEMVQIYKSRVQGKAKGEVAQELTGFFIQIPGVVGGKK